LLTPSQIDAQLSAAGEADGRHRILYDGRISYVCSEAKALSEVSAREFAHKIRNDIEQRPERIDFVLKDVQSALERPREIRVRPRAVEAHDDTSYVMQLPDLGALAATPEKLAAGRSRRFLDFKARAVSEADARFAAVGFEAWATGSQLVAVTLPE
jgi:hypothetical protein